MTPTLHIIASCTDRKRRRVPAELHLGNVKAADIGARARAWWQLLLSQHQETVQAADLYAGAHWRAVLELPGVARANGFRPRLWIASAGYGLIPEDASIQPYSATFARGNADSVVTNATERDTAEQLQTWWKTLSEVKEPSKGQPRSIKSLAKMEPGANILIIASPGYVAALEEDLVGAARQIERPESILIVSTPGSRSRGELAPHWIPSSAHHQTRLGGSKLSLHARVARELIEGTRRGRLDANVAQQEYERHIESTSPPVIPNREPMSDAEVTIFVRRAVMEGTKSWSAALRLLRSEGRACEQSRFKRLFLRTQGGS